MLRIYILEDDILQQCRIEKIIKNIIDKKSLRCHAPDIFGKTEQLLEAISERGSHQLFFLDIAIKDDDRRGLEVAKEIRKKDPHATIVFITSHSELMPITFQYMVSALDFIDKALNSDYFYRHIESAIEYAIDKMGLTVSENSFHFETSMAQVQVPFNKILYFETSSIVHKVVLHTVDERLEFYATISEIEKTDNRLYRCYKSFIVNPKNITKIDKENKIVIFGNGDSCLVSKLKLKGLKERVAN